MSNFLFHEMSKFRLLNSFSGFDTLYYRLVIVLCSYVDLSELLCWVVFFVMIIQVYILFWDVHILGEVLSIFW